MPNATMLTVRSVVLATEDSLVRVKRAKISTSVVLFLPHVTSKLTVRTRKDHIFVPANPASLETEKRVQVCLYLEQVEEKGALDLTKMLKFPEALGITSKPGALEGALTHVTTAAIQEPTTEAKVPTRKALSP